MTIKNHFDGENYTAEFNSVKNQLPRAEIKWFNQLRQTAISQFQDTGIPGPKVEEWKYSNLNILKTVDYGHLSESDVDDHKIATLYDEAILKDVEGAKVVFCDGYFNKTLSSLTNLDGITLMNVNEFIKVGPRAAQEVISHKKSENSLNALNMALMTDGMVLLVKAGIKLAKPIQVIHITTDISDAKALRKKNFIILEENSSAQLVESYVGDDNVDCWTHNVTDIVIGKGASLDVFTFQNEGSQMIHMSETTIDLAQHATFKHHSLNLGAKLSRTEIKPTLNGTESQVFLRGAFLSRDGNSHDVFSHMKHMVPECNSDQNYRGVLAAGGKSAFQGRVYVAKDAQLTNADQSNKNLLLDRNAEANSKPELLIYADDVKCSHGATVGELDEQALFYLKSRGLDHEAAKALLVEAFITEIYEDITIEPIREKYLNQARNWLMAGQENE